MSRRVLDQHQHQHLAGSGRRLTLLLTLAGCKKLTAIDSAGARSKVGVGDDSSPKADTLLFYYFYAVCGLWFEVHFEGVHPGFFSGVLCLIL